MQFINAISDAIFPPRCVSCKNEKEESALCNNCANKIKLSNNPIMRMREYPEVDSIIISCDHSSELRKAIHSLKYRMYQDVAKTLGNKIVDRISNLSFPKDTIIIPVPLYFLRQWWRGFNQAEVLAKIIAGKFCLEFDPKIIRRTRHTKSQMKLGRAERLVNLKDAFRVVKPDRVLNKNIILVDDVITTGATLGECAGVLKKAGAKKVLGLVLSRGI